MAPLPATLLLADLLAGFSRAHPAVTLSANVAGAAELGVQLSRNAIEFFFSASAMLERKVEADSDWIIEPFITLPQSLIVRAGHPLAGQAAVSADDLSRFPLAGVSPDFLDTTAGRHRLPQLEGQDIAIQCDDYAVLLDLTLRSDAVWIASRALAYTQPHRLDVLKPAFALVPDRIAFVIVRDAGRTLSPAAGRLIALARALAGEASH